MTSKVYFTDLRTTIGVSQLDKLEKLIRSAGIGGIDFDHKMTAIKMHFGEPGNLTFLRPNYAKRVADVVKSLGGIPFLTDCNTLYPGRRKNALEHIEAAYENGFTPFSTGCQILIGDGLKGADDMEVPVRNGRYVKTAKIGRAIMDADVFISLSHFKGHEMTGFGGAIKNIGMGCGSRRGKLEQHAAGKPLVNQKCCVGCRQCAKQCAQNAFSYENNKAAIDHDKCAGCGRCIAVCPFDAIYSPDDAATEMLDRKMAEYAMAVVDGRPNFHISLVINNLQDFSLFRNLNGRWGRFFFLLCNRNHFLFKLNLGYRLACIDLYITFRPFERNEYKGEHHNVTDQQPLGLLTFEVCFGRFFYFHKIII